MMILKPSVTLLSTSFVLSKNIENLGNPSCQIPEQGQNQAVWNKCAFNLDPDAWYAVSNNHYNHEQAFDFCESLGAELISVTSENLDRCAFDIIDTYEIEEEPILYTK